MCKATLQAIFILNDNFEWIQVISHHFLKVLSFIQLNHLIWFGYDHAFDAFRSCHDVAKVFYICDP